MRQEQTVNNNRFKYRENNTLVLEHHYCNEHNPSNIYESLRCICTLVMQITIYAYNARLRKCENWFSLNASFRFPFLFPPLSLSLFSRNNNANDIFKPSLIAKRGQKKYSKRWKEVEGRFRRGHNPQILIREILESSASQSIKSSSETYTSKQGSQGKAAYNIT